MNKPSIQERRMLRQKHWLSVLFGFLPVINVYSFFDEKITFAHAIILITSIAAYKNTIRVKRSKIWNPYFLLMIFSMLSTVLVCLSQGYDLAQPMKRMSLIVFYFINAIFLVENNAIDVDVFKKAYIKLAIFASIGILLQHLVKFLFGANLFLLIPGFHYSQSTIRNYAEYSAMYMRRAAQGLFTPTAFFLEPTQAAMNMSPAIACAMQHKIDKPPSYKLPLFLSMATLLTGSGESILLVGFVWFWAFWSSLRSKSSRNKNLFGILIVILVLILIFGGSMFRLISGRWGALTRSEAGSATYHLTKGYLFFAEMPLTNKIFGIGWGNYMSFVANHAIEGSMHKVEYMNSFSYVLVSAGLFGMIFFFCYLAQLYKYAKKRGTETFFFIFLLVYLSESVFFTVDGFFMLLLILLIQRENSQFLLNRNAVNVKKNF